MIYPEPGLADQFWIPWWIILIAVLAGILLLTLLVCLLWKVTHTFCYTCALKTLYLLVLNKKKNQLLLVLACFLTSKTIWLHLSSYFSHLLLFFLCFHSDITISSFPTLLGAHISIFQLSLCLFYFPLSTSSILSLCSGHLLSSVASSNAPSRAATMRRSTTAPNWGSSPRRWRSRRQNYNTTNISLWPALPSSYPSRR